MGNKDKKKQTGSQEQQSQGSSQQQNHPPGQSQHNPRQQQASGSSGSNRDQSQGSSQRGSQQGNNQKRTDGWICKQCNQNNFARNVNCYNRACNAPKPTSSGEQGGGDFRQPQQYQQQQVQYVPRQPFPQQYAPRPTQQPYQQSQYVPPRQPFPQQNQPFSHEPAPQQHQQWAAPQPVPQPSQVSIPQQQPAAQKVDKKKLVAGGDWNCPGCQSKNFAKKNACTKCKTPRPAPVEVPIELPKPAFESISSTSLSSSSDVAMPDDVEFEKINISPPKYSKHSSPFMIETSPNPKIYEGTRGKACKLEVNYGLIQFNKSKMPKNAYHYDVSFEPDVPKKFLPYALDQFMRELFPNYIFGTDGRKIMYTVIKLKRNGSEVDGEGLMQEVLAVMGDRQKKFQVKVKFAGVKDLSIFLNYTNPAYQNEDKPSEAIQVLDVVLRSALKNVRNAIPAGRGLYFAPQRERENQLGDGMELWYGLFQSAILGRSSIYLNVDVLHKAFPSSMPLLEFVASLDRNGCVPQTLDRWSMNSLKEHLKMLTIGYRMNPNEPVKTYGFNDLIEPNNATFTDDNGKHMTVAQYFKDKRGRILKYPNLPYLWVGSKIRKVYLPLELCEIPAGQATNKKCTPTCTANIIKFSATSTDVRKQKIRDLLRRIDYQTNPVISGFGIEVNTNFQTIDGRVINPPQIKYKNSLVTPAKGVWREGKFLDASRDPIRFCIINCDDRTQSAALMDFKRNIMQAALQQSLNLADMQAQEIRPIRVNPASFKNDIVNELGKCLQAGYRLVFVIVVDRNDCYARVKQAAELKVGILTQCIKAQTIFKMGKGNPLMTINNILLKVNSKLNGTNQMIQEPSFNNFNTAASGVMFVGADVTHPSPDQRDMASVVGVASSYDEIGFRYGCAWRLQDPTKEMIVDLENILVTHLQFYQGKNKRLPTKILYYRDGVSDGQFKEVLSIEMRAINAAMHRVYGTKEKAKVTFIVVQKRHHTRFFPVQKEFSDQTRFNNIVPGTVVDKNITHPFQYQFFMASHAAIQGVTKPTKYCILINESKIAPDDIQAITYDLCHYFTRCNRAVSYPAPTYYAHLVAARGKNYIVGDKLNMSNLQREFTTRVIQPAIVNNSPMFFV